MSLDRPLWLLAVPALALFFAAVQRAGLSGLGGRRRTVALGVRIALVAALVLALAGLRLGGSGDRLAVVFLVDRSDSVGAGGADRALDFVARTVREKPSEALVAVVAFGREPRLEFGMTDTPQVDSLAARPDASATDLARALRLAAALFPDGTKRRIVVLSDGRETDGDARREAARLARDGIRVDAVPIEVPAAGDVAVEALQAPGRVRRGESYRVGAVIRAIGSGPAHLIVTRDGKTILERDLTVPAGRSVVSVDEPATAPGVRRYEARLAAVADAVPENDRASAAVIVEGPPRVLIVEGGRGEAAALARALRAARMDVDVRSPEDFPAFGDLLAYDSTLLVDVPAAALGAGRIASLRAAVSEAGAGLLTVGGEDSYALGGYRGSELETLLPVSSEIQDPKRRPSVAEAIVVDTSGSMARCHCRDGAMGPQGEEGGINKTDISRAGAARAIRALSRDDIVGVLAFNTRSKWVVPLQKLPPEDVVRQGLEGMRPEGGTNIPQALQAAASELRQTKAKLKHIILFTDGWTNQSELVGFAERISAQGVTLSVVATGEGTGDVLAKMADAGRGRFYAGTNLADVPQVMMQEAILASRNYINEGVFRPTVAAETPITERLTAAPALLGYVATSVKPAATLELSIGPEDPLLASWRAGLGTVVSWTSDAKSRWSRAWVGWQGFRDFWARAVRSTFAAAGGGGFATEARILGNRLHIEVAAERTVAAGTEVVARVVGPSLQPIEVVLERTGPGRFRGEAPVGEPGAYLASVQVREGNALVFRGSTTATLSYSAEYLVAASDASLLADVAAATGGRSPAAVRRVFDPAGLRAHPQRREMWPLLALLAAFLLPADVAVRRLVVSREDLRRAYAAASRRARERFRRAPPAEREERMERLLDVKQRARRRTSRGSPEPARSDETPEAAEPPQTPPDPPPGD